MQSTSFMGEPQLCFRKSVKFFLFFPLTVFFPEKVISIRDWWYIFLIETTPIFFLIVLTTCKALLWLHYFHFLPILVDQGEIQLKFILMVRYLKFRTKSSPFLEKNPQNLSFWLCIARVPSLSICWFVIPMVLLTHC